MKDKFLVKVPIDLDDLSKGYREVRFKTYKEVAEFLDTSPYTVKSIIEGKVKFAYEQTKHLEDIKIELIDNKPAVKTQEERKEYIRSLLEKAG
jgi:hypothetical protein